MSIVPAAAAIFIFSAAECAELTRHELFLNMEVLEANVADIIARQPV